MPLDARGAEAPATDPADDVRKPFETLHGQYQIPDVLVFRQVYEGLAVDLNTKISRQAHDALGRFLRDVTTCPSEVLAHARELLLEREHPLPPIVLAAPQLESAIVVARAASTYRGRVPNHTPHPIFVGQDDFDPVKSS